ncbi:MAG: hypothetical protein ACI9HB_003241 [Gammaproteobacteria bacterium]|jgi:hypothetical protein
MLSSKRAGTKVKKLNQVSATIYFSICLGVILFQICVIAGAPWGRLTQGGFNHGKLPTRNRVGAGFSIFLMIFMGLSIYSAAGSWPNWPIWTGWITLATTVVSVIMNLLTPSAPERMLWAPITMAMLGLALFVMLSN